MNSNYANYPLQISIIHYLLDIAYFDRKRNPTVPQGHLSMSIAIAGIGAALTGSCFKYR
jgi:4-hydroxybenzoate polyprenyltransferase